MGKVGLERGKSRAGGQRRVCHRCHHPSMWPGWFWLWPEGSPTPPSVQRLGAGGGSGNGEQYSNSPFCLPRKVPTWKLTASADIPGAGNLPPAWSTCRALHEGKAPWWHEGQFWGGWVGPSWIRQGAFCHAGPFLEPSRQQKPWLTWSCCLPALAGAVGI